MDIFSTVPYSMVEKNIARVLHLRIGMEIYFNNHVIEEIDLNHLKELGKTLHGLGIPCTTHAPYMDLSPGGVDRKVRTITKDKLKRTVEAACILEARACVCHPGYDRWRFSGNEQVWLDGSLDTWTEVIAESKGGPLIVLENIFEEQPSTFVALFDHFREQNLWFCFDSGHFNLFSKTSIEAWLVPLRGRIRELHLHDNRGSSDDHLPLGEGTFPFRELKAFLGHTNMREIIFTAEPNDEDSAEQCVRKMREFIS